MTPLAAFLCSDATRSRLGRRIWIPVLACLAPGLLIFVAGAFAKVEPTRREELRAVEKSIAHYLRARSGKGDVVALASPDATTNLIYYGGIRGIGTFYWENNEGLKRAAEILSATDFAKAKRLIDEAEISYIVVYSWGGFEREYINLYRDFVEGGGADAGPSLLMSLVQEQKIPSWLRPIPFRVPGSGEDIALVFEVVEEMREGEAAATRFEYLLEMGRRQAASSMQSSLLRLARDDESARISLARLAALTGQEQLFA